MPLKGRSFTHYDKAKLICESCDREVVAPNESSNSSSNSKLTGATVISRKSTIHLNSDTADDLYSLPVMKIYFFCYNFDILNYFESFFIDDQL